MNTIPITFNENIGAYNIVGGEEQDNETTENYFSVFILHRCDSIISDTVFENILSFNFKSVFAILNNPQTISIESLSTKFPSIKFIRTLEKVTTGEMINICANESLSKFFIVLWTDTIITSQGFITTMLDQLNAKNKICTVPSLLSSKLEVLPNQIIPMLTDGKIFTTQKVNTIFDKTKTIYPFDFIGIYNRESFTELAGFDHTLKNSYWQLLDFSLRAFLWGYSMTIATSFKVQYLDEIAVEDTSIDESYRKFFLKNLAPSIKKVNGKNEAYIPFILFFSYLKNSGENFFRSWKKFKAGRAWVTINKDRFENTALNLLSSWETKL
ncbi:MAG: hypothetical protein P1P64_03940 [Treponemataceae bacterium]